MEDGGSKVEVLRQSQSSQIHINQNNTKKFHSSGGGWRYNATKNSGRKGTFCWVLRNGNIIYNSIWYISHGGMSDISKLFLKVNGKISNSKKKCVYLHVK